MGKKANDTLAPVKVETKPFVEAQVQQHDEVDVPPGYVYIVSLDGQGHEKPNSGFFYPIRHHERYYGDKTKFLIKKKRN